MDNFLLTHNPADSEDAYIFISLNDIDYAISTKCIVEITKLVQLNVPESLPRHIAGIIEYNRSMINIVDLRSVLSLPEEQYTVNNQIVVISADDMIFGIVVDNVSDVRRIDKKYLQAPPYKAGESFVQAIYTENTEQVIFLDINSIAGAVKSALLNTSVKNTRGELLPTDIHSRMILEQRGAQLSKKTPAQYGLLSEKDQYMSLLIDEVTYCVKLEYIKSFSKISREKITQVPCTPGFIVGLLNIKGDYITIIDLKNYLHGEPGNITDKSVLIILNSGEFKLGFVVDAIGENINIPQEKVDALRADIKSELIDYVKGDKLRYILNIAQMLNNERLYIR